MRSTKKFEEIRQYNKVLDQSTVNLYQWDEDLLFDKQYKFVCPYCTYDSFGCACYKATLCTPISYEIFGKTVYVPSKNTFRSCDKYSQFKTCDVYIRETLKCNNKVIEKEI